MHTLEYFTLYHMLYHAEIYSKSLLCGSYLLRNLVEVELAYYPDMECVFYLLSTPFQKGRLFNFQEREEIDLY